MGLLSSVSKKITSGGFSGKKGKTARDPLGLGSSRKKPEAPQKTAAEAALEIRQRKLLDEEIEKTEELLAAQRRGTLGFTNLLSGAARTRSEAARGTRGSSSSSGGSLLGGSSGGSSGGRSFGGSRGGFSGGSSGGVAK